VKRVNLEGDPMNFASSPGMMTVGDSAAQDVNRKPTQSFACIFGLICDVNCEFSGQNSNFEELKLKQ
jgi:hypothetical protein